MSRAEAGWYPDEDDAALARYWDGSDWTDHTRAIEDVGGEAPDHASGAPDAPAQTTRLRRGGGESTRPARRGPDWSTHPRTLISAFFVVAALIVGAVVVFTGDSASATEVTLEGAGSDGADPFMDSIATDAVAPEGIEAGGVEQVSTGPETPVATVSGATPGLYGGTGDQAVCDPAAMVEFLDANPDKAAAFAGVQGIEPGGIGDFVAGLTAVLLREDTRVTNHGFSAGAASPVASVLQAGTAVLVDQRGVPRVRCACGNPLTEPAGSTTNLTFTGTAWAGFSGTRLVAVDPAPNDLDTLTVTDIDTGDTTDIAVGTGTASGDTGGVVLLPDGLGVVDFGASPDDTIAALTEALGEPDEVRDIPGRAGNVNGEACMGGVEEANGVRVATWGRLLVGAGPTAGFYVWRFDSGPAVPGLDQPDSALETPEGLGQGATRAEFEAAYPPVAVEAIPEFEGEAPTGDGDERVAAFLTSPSGYGATTAVDDLSQISALSRPSNEVCVGFDGFSL